MTEQPRPPMTENIRSEEVENATRQCLDILSAVGVTAANDGRVRSAYLCLERELAWQDMAEEEIQTLEFLNTSLVNSGLPTVSSAAEATTKGFDMKVWNAASKARQSAPSGDTTTGPIIA